MSARTKVARLRTWSARSALLGGAAAMAMVAGCGPVTARPVAGGSLPPAGGSNRPVMPSPSLVTSLPTGSSPVTSHSASASRSTGTPPVAANGKPAGAGIGGPTWTASQKAPTKGRYLYVSPGGSDNNDGLSEAKPFKTLRYAADRTRPGDTVLIRAGVYSAPGRSNVLAINRAGTADRWITFAAYPNENPVLQMTRGNWQGVNVSGGAAYINVVGLTVVGQIKQLTEKQKAAARRTDTSDATISGLGFAVNEQKTAKNPRPPHHVRFWGNTARECPLGGFSAQIADYVSVEYNIAHDNSHWSPYGGSNYSFHGAYSIDNNTGYKMILRGNISYNARNLVNSTASGGKKVTDGNGFILDSFNDPKFPAKLRANYPYRGRTLIENNISYNNGGAGITVFDSSHTDVVNNTTHHNGKQPSTRSEFSINTAKDVRVFNNIFAAEPGTRVSVFKATQVTSAGNLVSGGPTPRDHRPPADPRGITGDPMFVDAGAADFRLRKGSPAVDSGTDGPASKIDINRRTRIGQVDRGAIELR